MFLNRKRNSKKKNRSLFYRISAWLHLWLGLVTGVVIIVVSLTGAVLVFEQELRIAFQPYQTVSSNGKGYLAPSVLKQNVMREYHLPAVSAVVYQGKDRAAVVPYYLGTPDEYRLNYIDPYTGKPLHTVLFKNDFFRVLLKGHYNLWLPMNIGKPVVAYSTLIFVVTLITGLVLWWPKKWNKSTREKSFKIKWGAGIKRINYDLHNVLGFYSILIALILGLTGMYYGMQWFSGTVYKIASGGKTPQYRKVERKADNHTRQLSKKQVPLQDSAAWINAEDSIFYAAVLKGDREKQSVITFSYPFRGKGNWNVSIMKNLSRRSNMKTYSFDAETLKQLPVSKKNNGDKYIGINYDLHVGSIGGTATKILAALVCIISASLPVTGLIIWLNKKKKKRKPRKIMA